jgi:hypothetical protein
MAAVGCGTFHMRRPGAGGGNPQRRAAGGAVATGARGPGDAEPGSSQLGLMLVEVEGERVWVLAGLSLRARLVQVLGPAQALRVTQLTLAGAPSSSPVRA